MVAVVIANGALLAGVALLMLGHGLQSTLLGVRASIEEFPTAVTGLIMSAYFIGFLFGSIVTPRMVKRVGHIRVFAAVASLASAAILLHILFITPVAWFFSRVLTGLCLSSCYIVAESWLNGATDNANRGQLLSIYMVVQLMALSAGQFLLGLADPAGFELFVVCSVLISLAVIPLLLSASPAPAIATPKTISLIELYRNSPLGVIGMAMVGISMGGMFSMGPVFARESGFSLGDIALFMAAINLGGVLLQWPIGQLSDRIDRRLVITVVTFLASASLVIPFSLGIDGTYPLVAAFFLFGGLVMPMYSLLVAHTNDNLDNDQMVAASGALVLANGIGAVSGPAMIALVMDWVGNSGFILALIGIHLAIGLFALFRMTRRQAVPLDEQGPHVYIPTPTAVTVPMAQEEAVELLTDDEAELPLAATNMPDRSPS